MHDWKERQEEMRSGCVQRRENGRARYILSMRTCGPCELNSGLRVFDKKTKSPLVPPALAVIRGVGYLGGIGGADGRRGS